MPCKASSNGNRGSYLQAGNSITCNSKYSNISVINSFRQLNNAEPVIHRGTIQTASSVNSNLYANVLADIKVSDSFVINRNMTVLTYCETLQKHLVQGHCCAYSHGIVHKVDIIGIDSIGNLIQCLYLHPASGVMCTSIKPVHITLGMLVMVECLGYPIFSQVLI